MKVAVIGAGMQAEAICFDLVKQEDVDEILLVDLDAAKIDGIVSRIGGTKIVPLVVNASCQYPFVDELKAFGPAAVLSAAPYHLNLFLMAAALEVPCHFCDLGGSNDVLEKQKEFSHWAEKYEVSVISATGLAPGLPGHIIADALVDFDSVDEVHVRVGGVPAEKGGLLDYSLVFSAEGLFNEMGGHARVLRAGVPATEEALTGVEHLFFPDVGHMEAFVTTGALSTLPESFAGQIQELDYKTIRYPGHAKFFITAKRLGLMSLDPIEVDDADVQPRKVFEAVAGKALDTNAPDLILMKTTVKGIMGGKVANRIYQMVVRPADGLSAMARATAFPASIVLLMLARGEVSMTGFAPLEKSIEPKKFMEELAARGIQIEVIDLPG